MLNLLNLIKPDISSVVFLESNKYIYVMNIKVLGYAMYV